MNRVRGVGHRAGVCKHEKRERERWGGGAAKRSRGNGRSSLSLSLFLSLSLSLSRSRSRSRSRSSPEGLRSRTLRSELEGSHILSRGAVNLARTQIKFLAPAERKECVISLRLYERRRDQRPGKPGPPIRLIERNVYPLKRPPQIRMRESALRRGSEAIVRNV